MDIENPTQQPNGAQSPNPSAVAFAHGASGEKLFTQEDVARIRKEEKDKLYPDLTTVRDQLSQTSKALTELKEQRDLELAEVNRKSAEKEAELTAKREAEMSSKALLETKIKETNDNWEKRFAKFEEDREFERAQMAKERAYNELSDYRVSRLNAEADNIAPQFHPFISGDTKDEIENKINQAKAATQEIVSQVTAAQQTAPVRGVSPTGYTALGPMDAGGLRKEFTAADINNMSMSEYSTFREKIGLAGQQAQSSRGILG